MSPFDFINSITQSKKDLITKSENPDLAEKLLGSNEESTSTNKNVPNWLSERRRNKK